MNNIDGNCLKCVGLDNVYTNDKYKFQKSLFVVVCFFMFICFTGGIYHHQNDVVGVLSTVLVGVVASILAWWLTIYYQDKQNRDLNYIEIHILNIQQHIDNLQLNAAGVNYQTNHIVRPIKGHTKEHKLLLFVRAMEFLCNDKLIDSSDFKLCLFNGELVSLTDWVRIYEDVCVPNEGQYTVTCDCDIDDDIFFKNYVLVSSELSHLMLSLRIRKHHIYCNKV